MGNPSLAVYLDTTIMDTSRGSFCQANHKHTSFLQYTYVNSGHQNLSGPPGNARVDSLRIYLSNPINLAWIDTSTIKINGIHISNRYVTNYASAGDTITVIDLTRYPAGSNGHPFGYNTICDLNGLGFADGLAEDSSFVLTDTLIYDTLCPPYQQIGSANAPAGFSIAAIWVEYNNMCFSGTYNRNLLLSPYSFGLPIADYNLSTWQDPETSISAPTDILGTFNLTACPVFDKVYSPANFNLDCPNGYRDLVVPLPIGYRLDTFILLFKSVMSPPVVGSPNITLKKSRPC
jgi:hypothetical protein